MKRWLFEVLTQRELNITHACVDAEEHGWRLGVSSA
jgi:hypothetical protein